MGPPACGMQEASPNRDVMAEIRHQHDHSVLDVPNPCPGATHEAQTG